MSSAETTAWSSGSQSPMFQSCDTTRVPGASSNRILGRRSRFTSGSRYIVTTVAFRISVSKMSCFKNFALSATPSRFAFLRLNSISSLLYSIPSACAP